MKAPTPASFAPGLLVGGKMVSATSPRKSTVAGSKRLSTLLVACLVHPSKNRLAPTTVPPIIQATRANASLLFIAISFLKLTFLCLRNYHRLPFFSSDVAKSTARAVSAMYVSEGFTHAADVIHAPSVTNTFGASHTWLFPFSTD